MDEMDASFTANVQMPA